MLPLGAVIDSYPLALLTRLFFTDAFPIEQCILHPIMCPVGAHSRQRQAGHLHTSIVSLGLYKLVVTADYKHRFLCSVLEPKYFSNTVECTWLALIFHLLAIFLNTAINPTNLALPAPRCPTTAFPTENEPAFWLSYLIAFSKGGHLQTSTVSLALCKLIATAGPVKR